MGAGYSLSSYTGAGSKTFNVEAPFSDPRIYANVSPQCDLAMSESANYAGDRGELLLKETGNICATREEWEAALYRHPRAIGVIDPAYLDGSEYDLLCRNYPEVKICL